MTKGDVLAAIEARRRADDASTAGARRAVRAPSRDDAAREERVR